MGCIYKISYQCICITVKKWKCNTWGCIILFNSIKVPNTRFDPRGGNVLKGIAYLLSDYSNQNWKFQNRWFIIPGLSRTYAFFPGLSRAWKILNNKIPQLSRVFMNPVNYTSYLPPFNNPFLRWTWLGRLPPFFFLWRELLRIDGTGFCRSKVRPVTR